MPPALYNQHIANKINVTTLQGLNPQHLDKPFLTSTFITYANKFKQCTAFASLYRSKFDSIQVSPLAWQTKPTDITFDDNTQSSLLQKPQSTLTTTTIQNTTTATTMPPTFNYQAELSQITNEIKTNLKAKFEAVIAHLNQAVINLHKNFEKKLLPLPTINQFYWSTNVSLNNILTQYVGDSLLLPLAIIKEQYQSINVLIDYFVTWYKGDFFLLSLPTISQFYWSTNLLINYFLTWYKGDSFLLPLATLKW